MLLFHQTILLQTLTGWVQTKCGQVGTRTSPRHSFSQYPAAAGSREGCPTRFKGLEDSSTCLNRSIQLSLSFPQASAFMGSIAFQLHESVQPVWSTTQVRPVGLSAITAAVAGPFIHHYWNPYATFPGRYDHCYECLYPVVECQHWRFLNFGNHFPTRPKALHINSLELKAVPLALHHWAPVLQGH